MKIPTFKKIAKFLKTSVFKRDDFQKRSDIFDISFHWKTALGTISFLGIILVALSVFVFYQTQNSTVFVSPGAGSSGVESINQEKLEEVLVTYGAREREINLILENGLSIPEPTGRNSGVSQNED